MHVFSMDHPCNSVLKAICPTNFDKFIYFDLIQFDNKNLILKLGVKIKSDLWITPIELKIDELFDLM